MLLAASVVFVYYTTWAILLVEHFSLTSSRDLLTTYREQPFLDASSPVHDWFPSREWAVRLPAFVLVVGMSAIGIFVGSTIVKENRKKAEKVRLRTA
jgi:dolichyl-phosphate mannosyltransferase polypeptide 2 regulatory subunit